MDEMTAEGDDISHRHASQADMSLGAIAILLWILGLASLGVAIYAGWQVWLGFQDGYELYWQHFWLSVYALGGLTIAIFAVSTLGPMLQRLRPFMRDARSRAERVRAAAITGDDKLAPLAAEQPEPLPTSELPIRPVTFGPFGSPKKHRRAGSALGQSVALLVVSIFVMAVVFAAVAVALQFLDSSPIMAWMRPMLVITVGMFVLMTLLSFIGFIVAIMQRLRGIGRVKQVQIVADDWGIRQIVGRRDRERPFPWHEVRAFYKADDIVHLQGSIIEKGMPLATAYTLATTERSISWPVSVEASAEQRTDSERLARLIVARTHLSLRDMTGTLTQFSLDALELVTPLLPSRPKLASQTQTGHAATRRFGTTWPRWLRASRIAIVTLTCVAITVGIVAQGIQGFQYSNLIEQHIDYEAPYYTIDFRSNDNEWPSHAATVDDGSYSFTVDGYYITGAPGGRAMEAVLPQQYGDATVELTAGLKDVASPSDIGVVLHESADGTDKVVFTLTSSGGWMLVRMHGVNGATPQRTVLMSNDHSDAVQTGKDAYNFLTVIMRGKDYLCFVRDQLVGIYHDESGETLSYGYAGLWLGNSHAVGMFYYFSVYPAPK
jgi:hypothetical protein